MFILNSEHIGIAKIKTTEFERNDRSALLIRRLKSHHRETYLHSARVAYYTLLLAKAMNFSPQEQEIIYRSAWLHDIGKLHVSPRDLDHDVSSDSSDEHCIRGKEIASQWGDASWIDTDMILYHHENLDGTGYFGLNWKQQSMQIRLLRVTDSYDKVTKFSNKYEYISIDESFEDLFRWSDMMFDAEVVNKFHKVITSLSNKLLVPSSK